MRRAALAVAAALLLGGCATVPENRYYVLSADGPTRPPPAAPFGAPGLVLATLRLPGVLDRAQVVEGTGPHSVAVLEYDRWAEPLDQMASRVLADDLAARSASRVAGAGRERRLAVEVDAFMADTAGIVRLTGRWHELPRAGGTGTSTARRFAFSTTADPARREEVAAAMSRLLGRLADQVADTPS